MNPKVSYKEARKMLGEKYGGLVHVGSAYVEKEFKLASIKA